MAINPEDIDCFPSSDSTLLVRFAPRGEAQVNEELLAFAHELQGERAILNLHPAYNTLLLRFDPLVYSHANVEELVRQRLGTGMRYLLKPKQVDVPVCY